MFIIFMSIIVALAVPSEETNNKQPDVVDWTLVWKSVKKNSDISIGMHITDVLETPDGLVFVFAVDGKRRERLGVLAHHPVGVGKSSFSIALTNFAKKHDPFSNNAKIE